MKNNISFFTCLLIAVVLLQYRATYSDIRPGNETLKVTTWDAFGYYMYLPAIFIYHDYKELNWLRDIDKKYSVTGGNGWQAEKQKNGNYVFKYLGGVALMEIPFFFIGHFIALHYGYPPDGFSPPYQYALGFGVIFYFILALFLLRRILLAYFSDLTTSLSLLMVCLATNLIQYVSIDNGQSHGYIFPLYVLVLIATMKWHFNPRIYWAALMGYVIGLATISRPTEAIMLFIPLMWNTQTKEAAKEKWQQVRKNRMHLAIAGLTGFIGILPQLIYWKSASGSFIFDVGSKWEFLSPHFRVLFGWEKGWFIYTPVTVFFIAGMFFMKQFPFRKSVLWFCLLNIYIIIAWHDWRYGGSYSTRALVQSYPLFALPFAAITEHIYTKKWRPVFYLLCAYLVLVNLFQVYQYNQTILHYNDMNRKYYSRIYLNPHPTPLDMSLLDNDEILTDFKGYEKKILINKISMLPVSIKANSRELIGSAVLVDSPGNEATKDSWLLVSCQVDAPGCLWQSYLEAELQKGDSVKRTRIRLFSPISDKNDHYEFHIRIPEKFDQCQFRLLINSPSDFKGQLSNLKVLELSK